MEGPILKNIANVLSAMTILSCMFLKVPQIYYIWTKQSAEGIFVQAMLLEVSGFTIMTLYNFTNNYSIMTYLEYPIILVQVYIMFYYVLKFKQLLSCSIVPIIAILYVSTVIGFLMGAIPNTILSYLMPICTPLSGFAKVTYIYGIVKEKNADAISLTTWSISVATNLARMFTIYVDSADIRLLTNFLISTILSSAVLGTSLYYKKIYRAYKAPPRRCRIQSGARRHSHSE